MDRDFWERHWRTPGSSLPAHPYLDREISGLEPGTALDAGCGEGAEAIRLAAAGWRVTGVDISATALTAAAARAADAGVHVEWVRGDLTTWEPGAPVDLVLSSYAHAEIPQLDLVARIAGWVAPGGTLLVVAHGPEDAHAAAGATATAAGIAGALPSGKGTIETADEVEREIVHGHDATTLRDVVVRARRAG